MSLARNIFLLLHIIGFIGILGALLSQIPKNPKRILGGAMHSALLSLISGIALIGIRTSLHASDAANWEAPDHTKVGIKFLFLVIILVLGYMNTKKPAVSTKIWATMVGLTLINLVVALSF
ncbi:hypothetical protein MCEMZLE42_01003 [actinobacterium SCGC AAA044-D11]